jgi:hypothetical protein
LLEQPHQLGLAIPLRSIASRLCGALTQWKGGRKMKKHILRAFLASILLFLTLSNAEAQSLTDEYATLVARRSELEGRATEMRKALKDLESKTLTLEETWLICANGRWRFIWNSAVKTANENRAAFR